MSVNTELQNLLTKMGGSPSEEDSNSDLIKKISEAYDGSGGGSGGSSGPIYFDIYVEDGEDSTPENPTWVADKTYAEAVVAYNSGKILRMFVAFQLVGVAPSTIELSFTEHYPANSGDPEGLGFQNDVIMSIFDQDVKMSGLAVYSVYGGIDELGVYVEYSVLNSVLQYPKPTLASVGKVLTVVGTSSTVSGIVWEAIPSDQDNDDK